MRLLKPKASWVRITMYLSDVAAPAETLPSELAARLEKRGNHYVLTSHVLHSCS